MLNIWSMNKHDSIRHLLLLLKTDLPNAFDIHAELPADPRAIRLCQISDTGICAYIYTYGQDKERYGIHLEYPLDTDVQLNDTTDILENITYSRLLDLLMIHFEFTGPAPDQRTANYIKPSLY